MECAQNHTAPRDNATIECSQGTRFQLTAGIMVLLEHDAVISGLDHCEQLRALAGGHFQLFSHALRVQPQATGKPIARRD